MNKILLPILFLLALVSLAEAQQQPYYTQYILNPFIVNPALAGIENYWDVKISYRKQWQGLEGAPQTTYLTIHGPLKNIQYTKPTATTVPPPSIKKRVAVNHWIQYKAIKPHAGLGATFLSDKVGPITRYAINATYSYHLGLSPNLSIGAGLMGGVQGVYLNTDQLDFGATNPTDPAVAMNGVVRQIKPDIGFGLWLYSAFYFIGASIQNIVPLKMKYSKTEGENVSLVPHAILSAGYRFFLNDKFNFLPSAVVRLAGNTPLSFDINTKVQYQDFSWIGVSYRHDRSLAAMLGINVNSKLNVGYSYDITSSSIKYTTRGTHEIVIGILMGNRNRVLCPNQFW